MDDNPVMFDPVKPGHGGAASVTLRNVGGRATELSVVRDDSDGSDGSAFSADPEQLTPEPQEQAELTIQFAPPPRWVRTWRRWRW